MPVSESNLATLLLPPSSTPLERALVQAITSPVHTPELVATLWDAQACPLALLPWLAWALSVDEWDESWPEARKREAVQISVQLHRKKGTPWAVRRALLGAGLEQVRLAEKLPDAHWAEFDVEIDVYERPLPASALSKAVDLITAYKATRSHLRRLVVVLRPRLTRQLRTFCLEQREVTIFPRLRTELGARAVLAGRPMAMLETQSVEIYPR